MNKITEQITEILEEMKKPQAKINKMTVVAKLMILGGTLQEDDTVVPIEAFELLDNDTRKAMLMFFVAGIIKALIP